ncbi:peptide chain release factor 2 [Chloracidobacterium aggregatum]|uniref:peptide chain release factor 2 n=1 Tax=Chloracidobacterium aggregatum TaxID=2851959 RepID=UPI001B8B4DDE|nr:peptide chain release factor 2 [Chloracidobacterium aggregatum]
MPDTPELRHAYAALLERITHLRGFFDPESKRPRLETVEVRIAQPDFWNDQEQAQKILKERRRLAEAIETAAFYDRETADLEVLFEFAEADPASLAELEQRLGALQQKVEADETQMLLSGPNDANNAIVRIQSGAGGTDAQDWAEMLLRMYLRWCERRGFKTSLLDVQPGKEAGITSAEFTVEGDYAYGLLSCESGVHRLVRISPFSSAGTRETSFASIFVTPEVEDDIEIEINEKDLRIDTYRSSGAGGQHVNVTDSAIRITHLPTGIVVSCQNQRSQHQNREVAMKVLKSRLYELELERRRAESAKLEAAKRDISFGSQIRNYVLHPYRLVKDTRTKLERSDVDSVLDGDLDDFIKEYLVARSRQPDGVLMAGDDE